MPRNYVENSGRWGAVAEWAAALPLAGRDIRVLIAIAAARDRDKVAATISIEEIAVKTRIDRRNIQSAIRRLEEHGVLRVRRGAGRGHASIYTLIFNPALNSVEIEALSSTPNSVDFEQETASNPVLNSVQSDAPPEVPDSDPESLPSGEDAPARARTPFRPQTNGADNVGSRRGTRLPADWQPAAAEIEFATRHGLDPAATLEAFRDYWTAKTSRATKLDWAATWRTWCRNEQRWNRSGVARRSPAEDRYHRGKEISFRTAIAHS
jgi:biotin operon repressor